MEESFTARPLLGRWISLDVRPTRPLTFLGPAWAVLCGALTSGALALRGQTVLWFILSLLLCDMFLGAWRALWLQSDWRDALRRTRTSALTWYGLEENSTGWRTRLRNAWARWCYFRQVVWPTIDSEIVGMVIVGALGLCIGVVLGTIPLALTLATMVFAIVEGQIGTGRGAGLRAVSEVVFPWMIAQSAFGYFSWLSLVFALLFTLIYRALLGLATTRREHWVAWSNLAQVAVVLLLMANHSPAAVGIVLLGLLAQLLWQVRYHADRDGQGYARHVQSYVLVAMVLTGLSLGL